MRFEKIPYYLRYSIDEIIADARKHITVHYLHTIVTTGGKVASRGGTGCQVVDHTDYGAYFYEPKKFEMIEKRTIRSIDQKSAHQNATIALKKWEEEVRDFLTRPMRKMEETKTIKKPGSESTSHPTPISQIQTMLSSVARGQKDRYAKRSAIR